MAKNDKAKLPKQEATIQITKAKCGTGDEEKVFIGYTYRNEGHTDIRTSKSDEKAAPEFYDAFEKLREHVAKILGFTETQAEKLTPHTVSFSYDKEEKMGAVISCLYETPSGLFININSPLIRCPAEKSEEDSPAYFTEEAAKAVWEVELQARKYLTGTRAQISLFGEAEDAAAQDRAA